MKVNYGNTILDFIKLGLIFEANLTEFKCTVRRRVKILTFF